MNVIHQNTRMVTELMTAEAKPEPEEQQIEEQVEEQDEPDFLAGKKHYLRKLFREKSLEILVFLMELQCHPL